MSVSMPAVWGQKAEFFFLIRVGLSQKQYEKNLMVTMVIQVFHTWATDSTEIPDGLAP